LESTSEIVIRWCKTDEVQVDEQWSFVQNKGNQRWLWYAMDAVTGIILAFVLGKRTDEMCKELMNKLAIFKIKKYYTDDHASYRKFITPHRHVVGKSGTQKIENKNLLLRTRIQRLARKTICFSKSEKFHDIVIGLLINKYCFN
jgi:insertion element IS1 protein InsB